MVHECHCTATQPSVKGSQMPRLVNISEAVSLGLHTMVLAAELAKGSPFDKSLRLIENDS